MNCYVSVVTIVIFANFVKLRRLRKILRNLRRFPMVLAKFSRTKLSTVTTVRPLSFLRKVIFVTFLYARNYSSILFRILRRNIKGSFMIQNICFVELRAWCCNYEEICEYPQCKLVLLSKCFHQFGQALRSVL